MKNPPTSRLHHASACLVLAFAAIGPAVATTFVPSSDDTVVERLPTSTSGVTQRQRRLSTSTSTSTTPWTTPSTTPSTSTVTTTINDTGDDLATRLDAATAALQRLRHSGDPRDLGEAQALLAPWWSQAAPPASVRLLRARVLQSLHRFDSAMADLDALLQARDVDPALRRQARSIRAGVHQVQGRTGEARADCEALVAEHRSASSRASSQARVAQACVADLRSLQGDPEGAARALAALHAAQPDDAWLALLRSELAQRMGRPLEAVRLLEPTTSRSDASIYDLAAHADALIDAGRVEAALELITRASDSSTSTSTSTLVPPHRSANTPRAATLPEALQLRRVIAATRLRHPEASRDARSLRASFDAARLRGDAPHLREEAWLALDVEADAPRAWRLAQDNWRMQKEPIDALLYVRAARAASQTKTARDFVEQRRTEGWHDVRLTRALEDAR